MVKALSTLIGPVIFFFVGFYFFYKRRNFVKNGIAAEGEVVAIEKSGDNNYPVARFRTLTGEVIVARSGNTGYIGKAFKAGDKVQLFYKTDDPKKFIINGKTDKWLPLFFMIISVVLIILYLFVFVNKK